MPQNKKDILCINFGKLEPIDPDYIKYFKKHSINESPFNILKELLKGVPVEIVFKNEDHATK